MKKRIVIILSVIALIATAQLALSFTVGAVNPAVAGNVTYLQKTDDIEELMQTASAFVIAKHAPFGGSHYAYTEGLAEESSGFSPEGTESNFRAGSSLVYMTLEEEGGKIKQTQYELLKTPTGCVRDPDVSADGERIVFSWKKSSSDDFHLYEMDIKTQEITQLTYGSGVADIEPQYCANGEIIFSSTRAIQTVDCWKTPVSNIYKCSADGSNIIRLGYDQVHTTYPVTLTDGRVVYTRWDYNDRTQMFAQGLFQMNPDGTNQTELYGNNASFPTSLVHTREIPGVSDTYVSIATGHHTYQAGKMVLIDLSKGRESADAVSFVFPDQYSQKKDDVDVYGQQGPLYQYPYAISEQLFLASHAPSGWSSNKLQTPFEIYLMREGGQKTLLVESDDYPCANIIPAGGKNIFERPSMVDYSATTGTYYVADVYVGEGMEKVERGTVKSLRVVEIDYRAYAVGATVASGSGTSDPYTPIATGNGAWDVKRVLGVATVYEDGSAMFSVPCDTPVYFQLLDENGSVIQSMRSWSTLMPNEIYSCTGCHEDNNTAPHASIGVTMALNAGVETLRPDVWQTEEGFDPYTTEEGFSYLEEIQPILDANCVSCHNNKSLAYAEISASQMNNSGIEMPSGVKEELIPLQSTWSYLISSGAAPSGWNMPGYDLSAWSTGKAGFGDRGGDGANVGTNWSGDKKYIYLVKTFEIEDVSKYKNAQIELHTWFDDTVRFYLNGTLIYSNDGWNDAYLEYNLGTTYASSLKQGSNTLAISVNQHSGGRFIDTAFSVIVPDSNDPTLSNPISLESENLYASRMKKYFPLSYLVLTGSKPNSGRQWVGTPTNKYINWLSSMSKVTVTDANTYGSNKSALIERLRSGHGELTEAEIQTISAWIDLCVPCYGTYDENNAWSNGDMREAEEEQNKRDYYDMLDRYAKMSLAGKLPEGNLTVTFKGGTYNATSSGRGIVNLIVDRQYQSGDTVTVKLPTDVKYVGFTINARMGESIVYCPSGEFTFKLMAEYINDIYPESLVAGNIPPYIQNVITVRIPTKDELSTTRNLAKNIYDTTDNVSIYPHVTSDSEFEDYIGDVRFLARNAIDGFTANKGHGAYPLQSWGPSAGDGHHIKIDFGREVWVEQVGVVIRFGMPHDTFYKSGVLELSDGSTVGFTLECVSGEQIIKLERPVKTTYVKLKDLAADKKGGWAALSEVCVYGHEL